MKGYLNSGIKAILIFNLGNIWRCVDRKRKQRIWPSALKGTYWCFGAKRWLCLHSRRSMCGVSDSCKTCDLFYKLHGVTSQKTHSDIHHRDKFKFPINKGMSSLWINIFMMHATVRKSDSLSTRQETSNLSIPA